MARLPAEARLGGAGPVRYRGRQQLDGEFTVGSRSSPLAVRLSHVADYDQRR